MLQEDIQSKKIKHLYIHIPFCRHICHYCDFAKTLYNQKLSDRYLDVLYKEMECVDFNALETIYIGGGTPTALSYNQLENLLVYIRSKSVALCEYSIEVNPETIDEEKVILLAKYGINRVSIGVQSSREHLLRLMNRKHNFQQVIETVNLFKKHGILKISCDLMYSLPSQTMEDLVIDLNCIVQLDIDHISIYSLTIEENTYFKYKGYHALEEELESDMYEYICRFLQENGYEQYEIANFARNQEYSKHNLSYWRYDDFYGVGLGASAKINNQRQDNTRKLKEYLDGNWVAKKYHQHIKEVMFEHVMMCLRCKYGVNLEQFKNLYGSDLLVIYKGAIEKHKESLFVQNGHLICKNRGILHYILLDFMDN